ncbi:hypothetical protein ERJ75_001448100 [Trypanosoma vivax]|nr:hypothetical protein ERJ75_001448100 [Trypanosoma vivax]
MTSFYYAKFRRFAFIFATLSTFLFGEASTIYDVEVIADVSGTRTLTAEDIRNGYNVSGGDRVEPCGRFDSYGDRYVLTVEMGSFVDHLVPLPGVTVCNLLTSTTQMQLYRYAPEDPRLPTWNGYTRAIAPSLVSYVLGGSAENFVHDGRSTLSFWGTKNNATNITGGCCALGPARLLSGPGLFACWCPRECLGCILLGGSNPSLQPLVVL